MKAHFFIFALFSALIFSLSIEAQKRGDFMFPIQPNTSLNSLSGGMAELRSNHFHMGIDIRTGNRIGLPVYAAADGYVSRVKVRPYGYGNAIYIKHTNGTTTLYGHLSEFNDKVADYVRKIQYQRESFEVDLYLSPTQFPVKKGDIIALSGNSGSSGGPHVHFEIRDANSNALNPLDYGFDEIKDNVAPIMRRVAFVPLSPTAQVASNYNREEVPAYQTSNKKYGIKNQKITAHGLIGIELDAFDKADGVYFKYGIDEIEMYVNEESHFRVHFDRISFTNQRHMNNYINYEQYASRRVRYRKCYVPDGTKKLHFYDYAKRKGKLQIEDGKTYAIRIRMKDAYGNESNTYFDIIGKKPSPTKLYPVRANQYEIRDNHLVFNAYLSSSDSSSEVCVDWLSHQIKPTLHNQSVGTFIWDMRNGIPDSVVLPNGKKLYPEIVVQVPSRTRFAYFDNDFEVSFPNGALYDTLYLSAYKKSDDFVIGNGTVALQKYVSIELKPNEKIENKSQTHVYRVSGRSLRYEGGTWKNNTIKFRTRNLGQFRLATDQTPPSVRITSINSSRVRCRISDNRSGIASYRASIDGKWLLMNYDPKTASLTSELSDQMAGLKGLFKLVVTDNAGNTNSVERQIN